MRTPFISAMVVKDLLIASSDLLNELHSGDGTVHDDLIDHVEKLEAVVHQAWREHDAQIDAEIQAEKAKAVVDGWRKS